MQVGSWAKRVVIQYQNAGTGSDSDWGDVNKAWDNVSGLVQMGEVVLEANMIEVPTWNRIIKITSGITTMPEVQLTYETKSGVAATAINPRTFFRTWFENKNQKHMLITLLDATGAEQETLMWSQVEILRMTEPAVDFASPTYAQFEITVLPRRISVVKAKGVTGAVDEGGIGGYKA